MAGQRVYAVLVDMIRRHPETAFLTPVDPGLEGRCLRAKVFAETVRSSSFSLSMARRVPMPALPLCTTRNEIKVRKGKASKFTIAFQVLNTNDITMEAAPSSEHSSAIYTTTPDPVGPQ